MTFHQQLRGAKESVYTIFGIGLAGSIIFWPLLNSILSIVLFTYWLFFGRKAFDIRSERSRWVLLFTALYLLMAAGYFYSQNAEEAVFKLQQKLPLLIFPIVFGCITPLSLNFKRVILLSFVLFTVAGALFCIFNGAANWFRLGELSALRGYEMIALKGMSPFIFGLCCLLSATWLLDTVSKHRFKLRWQRISVWTMVIFLSCFLFLLGNRNMLFSWSIVVLYYFFILVRKWKWRLAFIGLMLFAFAIAVSLNPSLNKQWHDLVDVSENNIVPLDTDKSLGRAWGGKAIRVAIWKCSWDIVQNNLLTGVGTGDVQDELQKAYANRKFYFASEYNRYNAHNQYIQETIGSGFLGFLVFAGCVFIPLVYYVRKQNYRVYCFFLLAIAVIALTESLLELNKGIVFYSFFNSIFAFTENKIIKT